jgi:2-pyrone-4,6-dicarboxylate lactonase
MSVVSYPSLIQVEDVVPHTTLPVGSCDCHLHVFGDMERYPAIPGAAYQPPDAELAHIARHHDEAGITRAVIVQPTIYGIDHRLLIATLHGRPHYRGVAIVNDAVSDSQLDDLHQAGIRAARFSLGGPLGGMSPVELDRSVRRVGERGWQAKLGGTARDFIARQDWLRSVNCVAVLDHLAGINPSDGLASEMIALVGDLTQRGNWWLLLANADRRSQTAGWDDMLPHVRSLVAVTEGRAIWGSDWPHVLYGRPVRPEYVSLVAFLQMAVPDSDALETILVRNPAQLYGFDPAE